MDASGRGAATPTPLRVAAVVEQCWQPVPGGSGTYVVELLRALGDRPDVRVRGVAAAHRHPAPADVRPPVAVTSSRLPRRLLYDAWARLGRPRVERLVPGAEVVHATTWAIPGTARPLVVTVHDLAFLRDPDHFTARGVRFFRHALERTRDEAAAVVVPSEATAADCVRAGIERSRVHVVPHGVDVPDVATAQVAAFRDRHGLERPYVLWTGTREPRKNLDGLLRAFALLDADVDLVLVGPEGWGAGTEPADGVGDRVRVRVRVRERVHVLGRLPVAELHAAYAGAAAFCFPSLWEGFGLPVLEAMAHGVPVVTSAGTSTAEVLGDAGAAVDPHDPSAIAAALDRALGEEGRAWAVAGRTRAAGFTWADAARRTVDVYRTALG